MADLPDSAVEEIRIEHQDGEQRVLRGDEARAWFNWVAQSIEFTTKHGGTAPDVDWKDE